MKKELRNTFLLVTVSSLIFLACHVHPRKKKFEFKSCSCDQSPAHLPCKEFNFSYAYQADSLIDLLHNGFFVSYNKNNACCLKIMESLADQAKYKLHKICNSGGFFFQPCYYPSSFLLDTMAFLYRHDLRKLVTLYGYRDSSRLDSMVYIRFHNSDQELLKNYQAKYNMNPDFSRKYQLEDCRYEKFEWPNLKSNEGVNETFNYLLWEDSTLFNDYQYILCKKSFLMWTLASTKGYRLNRYKDGDGSFEFYLNGCYLNYDFSMEFKSDLRTLMSLYDFKDSAKYIQHYWK